MEAAAKNLVFRHQLDKFILKRHQHGNLVFKIEQLKFKGEKMKQLKLWQKMAMGFGSIIMLMIIGGIIAVNTASNLSGLT